MQDALTPMMQQYRRLRSSIPDDTLLLFRLGDFYELFFEDAKEAAGLLNVALTKRNGVPMCGVPYHAAQSYVAKLIKAGKRVAICDQTSEPQPGRIVTRDITQIISAGTVSDLDLLEAKRANYLGAVYADGGVFGFAYADLSTGEFRLTQLQDRQSLLDELARVGPPELLVSDEQKEQFAEIAGTLSYDSYAFLPEQAVFTLCEHFKVKSLDGFGCGQMPQAVAAAGAIVHYLKHQLRRKIDHLTSLRCDATAEYVVLDAATQANLELVESRSTRDTSLLAVLDRTITPMGGRKLRDWILQPMRNRPCGLSRELRAPTPTRVFAPPSCSVLRRPHPRGNLRSPQRAFRSRRRSSAPSPWPCSVPPSSPRFRTTDTASLRPLSRG